MQTENATQCAACLTVYDAALAGCPNCRDSTAAPEIAAPPTSDESFMNTSTRPDPNASANNPAHATAPPPTSTLIEFPSSGRANRPQWRKELSERVREIQQRRAQEAAREPEVGSLSLPERPDAAREVGSAQLGLVPQPETPELNPLVAKALERIERARQQQHSPANATRSQTRGAAAPAPARYAEEETYAARQTRAELSETAALQPAEGVAETIPSEEVAEKPAEQIRASALVIVPPVVVPPAQPAAEQAAAEADRVLSEALNKPRPRRHLGEVADEALLARREAAAAPAAHAPVAEAATDRAPVPRRLAAGLIDLTVVAFAACPFAAIIELSSGQWHDLRVAGSLAGIIVILMFVYLTATVAFSGRTLGMSLLGLRAVDARTGLIPATGQCVRRAIFYMLSLVTLGLGLLLALFDAEGRAAHDHLSGTVVVAD
jgi:uncharacterized RDD family membrane protein YckC